MVPSLRARDTERRIPLRSSYSLMPSPIAGHLPSWQSLPVKPTAPRNSARYMLDTNICIYLRQNRPPEVTARFRQMQHGDAVLSVITYGELLYGAERSQQRSNALESLSRLISLLPVLPLPA